MTTGTTPKGYPYPNGDDPIANGDNMITALATAVDTHLGRAAAGLVSAPTFGPQSMAVTFPVGRFTSGPRVVALPVVTASASNPTFVGISTGITTSGCTITSDRAAGGGYSILWLAVQV